MAESLPDLALLEKAWRVVYKPHLVIEHRGERKVEYLAIHYQFREDDPFGPASTASVSYSRFVDGRSRYIRAWVYNMFGATAKGCEVFVERIWIGDRLLDGERSPLHWADLDGVYLLPQMKRGAKYGHYIDICASDSVDHRFQVISKKALKGYHKFEESGTYRLELTAEARGACREGKMVIAVKHDIQRWDELRVLSTSELKKGLFDWITRPR